MVVNHILSVHLMQESIGLQLAENVTQYLKPLVNISRFISRLHFNVAK